MTLSGSAGSVALRRTTLSSVSLLTGIISRLAKLAAGRPPSASPR
jgi:hypothetical protein